MHLSCETRSRFPLLHLPDLGFDTLLAAGLWPVTKAEFELFLATGAAGFGDRWYEEVLALNPRASGRHFAPQRREELFLTAVRPEEAHDFVRWLGDDFDLPTAEEWREIDHYLRDLAVEPGQRDKLLAVKAMDPAARDILQGVDARLRPRTWGELTFLRGGVFEWVRAGGDYRALGGRTRPEFLRSVFNPQKDAPVHPFDRRSPYFGFRVVRRLPKPAAEGRVKP
jgi:hypothetical protein